MSDLISRAEAIDSVEIFLKQTDAPEVYPGLIPALARVINNVPSAQPTLYGYNIEHLALIATVLQKEDLPPDRVVEAVTDIGRIASIIRAECEEELKKAVERCMI